MNVNKKIAALEEIIGEKIHNYSDVEVTPNHYGVSYYKEENQQVTEFHLSGKGKSDEFPEVILNFKLELFFFFINIRCFNFEGIRIKYYR